MERTAAEQKILKHYGSSTTERKANMRAILVKRFGQDYDETESTLGEAIITEALTEDEFGTMLADTAEELSQRLYENYLE